jgi:hypothetical protein
MSVICGEMNFNPQTFKRMTLREVICLIKGYRRKQKDENIRSWEQARWISFIGVQPYSSKIKKPSQLIKFPWEKKTNRRIKGVNNDLAIKAILGG